MLREAALLSESGGNDVVKEARLIKIISPEMVRLLARTAVHAKAVGRRRRWNKAGAGCMEESSTETGARMFLDRVQAVFPKTVRIFHRMLPREATFAQLLPVKTDTSLAFSC